MNQELLVKELEELAAQLGIKVRYEKGDFDGGYCILKDQKILVVNKRIFDNRKTSVLAQGIYEIGVENVFVKPAVRQYIEDEVARKKGEAGKNGIAKEKTK
jgi:murein endopeptidase